MLPPMNRPVSRIGLAALLGVAAWVCIAIVAVLSLLPGQDLVRTDLARLSYGKQIEHFIAYFGTATCVALAYRTRLSRRRLGLILVAYAALLEIAQLYVPGRESSLRDFAASSAGALAGLAVAPLLGRGLSRLRAIIRTPAAAEAPPPAL
jgi:hypothetical protein